MRAHLFFGPLVAAILATPAFAQPVGLDCPALLDADAFPSNRRNYAPLYFDAQTGWILREGDNSTEFSLTEESVVLLAELVRLLRERTGTRLVVVVPPPRGIFASNGVDPDLNRAAYVNLLEQISSTGAIVPDILGSLDNNPEAMEDFYFKSDSHWTPNGSLLAAQAVASALRSAGAMPEQPKDPILEIVEATLPTDRFGNLLYVVEQVCGGQLPGEPFMLPEIVASQPDDIASALFDDVEVANPEDIVLVGTSFSHSDDFRWPESISYALQRPVSNRALSGGAFQLALAAYAENGLQTDKPEILIWEFLHYYLRGDVSKLLRDILGSVSGGCDLSAGEEGFTINFDDTDWSEDITIPPTHDILELYLPDTDLGMVEVQLRTPDRARLVGAARRVERIPAALRSERWLLNIAQTLDGKLVAAGGVANVRLRGIELPLEGTVVSCASN